MGCARQDESDDVRVQVKAGESYEQGTTTTEHMIAYRDSDSGEHEHIVHDDSGNVIHDTTGSA